MEQIEITSTASYEQSNPSNLLKYIARFDKFCTYLPLPLSVGKLMLFYVLAKAGLLLVVSETSLLKLSIYN